MRERDAFQELDYRAVFGSMAKWATEIDDPERIPEGIALLGELIRERLSEGPSVAADARAESMPIF